MKTLKLITAIAISGCLSTPALAEFASLRDIGTYTDWKVMEVSDHPLWHKDACMAVTSSKGAGTLEVYAEKTITKDVASYSDPLVQVVTPKDFPAYVRGILTDGKTVFHLMLAAGRETPVATGLIVRADERKKLADFLKKASAVRIQFITENNTKVNKTDYQYSLRGSSKAIDAAVKECGLVF